MRIAVVFASIGRAPILCKALDRLADQTRKPDTVYLSVVSPEDHAGVEHGRVPARIVYSPKGLCAQRNRALDAIGDSADMIVFFDDDFVPALDYLEAAERLIDVDPALVGLTGRLVEDGIHGEGIAFEEAVARLDVRNERPAGEAYPRPALYGCNMVIVARAARGLRFDERLPLYGWLEDIDYSHQVGRRGRMIASPEVTGIHLGVRSARQPGLRLGYSQVANVIHLFRKGTIPRRLGARLLLQNLASNLVLSVVPRSSIDRRGRLAGNLVAMSDLMLGRLDPQRMLRF